jgi:hypothetical protein
LGYATPEDIQAYQTYILETVLADPIENEATAEDLQEDQTSILPIVLADPVLNIAWHEQQAKAKLDAEQKQPMDEREGPLTIAQGKVNARRAMAIHYGTKRAAQAARKPLAKPYNPQ